MSKFFLFLKNDRSGIYVQTTGKYLNNHAVVILGYGTEGGVDYWLMANTWNESWGENGFFKIRRGTNEVHIESETYGGMPLYPEEQ